MIHSFKPKKFQTDTLTLLTQNPCVHILCLAATGSGKSYLFQKYLLENPHIKALLISPLNVLSQQHFKDFKKLGIRSTVLSPSMQEKPYTEAESQVWILSPEKIFLNQNDFFLKKIKKMNPQFLIVDECHCVFEWGSHFRPSFQKVLELIRLLQIPQSLWLTATLEKNSQQALKSNFQNGFHLIGSFQLAENLHLQQLKISHPHRLEFLLEFIQKRPPHSPGLVFTASRKTAEKISKFVNAHHIQSYYFHAGLSSEEKFILLQKLKDQKIQVLITTTAFGMGMNYPFFEWTLLYQPLYSISQMAQAFGRIGRNQTISSALGIALWDENDFYQLYSSHNEPKTGPCSLQPFQKQILKLYEFLNEDLNISQKFLNHFNS